jgi:hypothetical protein
MRDWTTLALILVALALAGLAWWHGGPELALNGLILGGQDPAWCSAPAHRCVSHRWSGSNPGDTRSGDALARSRVGLAGGAAQFLFEGWL